MKHKKNFCYQQSEVTNKTSKGERSLLFQTNNQHLLVICDLIAASMKITGITSKEVNIQNEME